ncbi:MAG: acetylxylan esterase [Planctomycetaceae bacterium]|jgi:cephalosporin-C deacetylase-like acetyl esterase|nr:acetylxylan esterase [Planctomycetaceae bacterium]
MKSVGRCWCVGFSVLVLFFGIASAFSQENKPAYQIQVRAEQESAIYKKGETVIFHIQLLENKKPLAGKELSYWVQGDGSFEKKGTVTSTDSVAVIETSLNRPGFLKCTVQWNDAPGGKISAVGGAGVDPLDLRAETPEPDDFDAFWNAKKEELAKLPMNPQLVPVPAEKVNHPAVQVFDIKIDCLGGKPVSGYLAKPVNAQPKSLPIVISYHGAGVRSAGMPINDAAHGVLALDVNAHGIENGQPEEFYKALADGELKNYRTAGSENGENIYFVGMFLRVIRSLQFMKSLPEWDGKTIAVKGGSQGGGQALVAAGSDPAVTFCVAHVPAICYPTGDIEGNFGGWPGFLRGKTKETANPAVVKAVLYIDAAHFARRIKAESILSTGFIDYTCSPTSVYVAYNNITAPKQIFPSPESTHAVPPKTSEITNKLFWDYIERNRVPKTE